MIHAKEAYYNSLNNDATGKQLVELDRCIREAANQGLYSCIYPGSLTANAELELEEHDFRFCQRFSNGVWFTTIEWGDE